MPSKKTSLNDVAIATSGGQNMKLRSPSCRRPAKIHTPKPAVKKKEAPAKQAKKPPARAVTTPKKKDVAVTNPKKKDAPVEANGSVLAVQPTDVVIPPLMTTPKKKTRSVQTILRRSPRCSSKLRVDKPSNSTAPQKTLAFPVNESASEQCPMLVPMLVDPPSKYPTRTVSSSLQTYSRMPSLTPSPVVSEHPNPPPIETNTEHPTEKITNDDEASDDEPSDNEPSEDEDPPTLDTATENPHDKTNDEDPNVEDFTDENSQPNDQDEVQEELLSIRCSKKSTSSPPEEDAPISETEPSKKRKRRGIVCGTKIANLVHTLGTRIKVDCSVEANGPVIREIRSMVCHQIGACVRQKVPMLAPTYIQLDPKNWDIVVNYLTPHFVLPKDDTLLWEYITRIENNRYKDWKSACHKHYLKNGKKVPKEFVHRKEEWTWLVKHFEEPAKQAISKRMKEARDKKKNHHGGKTPFAIQAVTHLQKGHKAQHVATYADAYSQEPECADIVDQMNAEVQKLLDDQQSDDPSSITNPLPMSTQLDIISRVVEQKKGTQVSGVGGNIRKSPRPRGGPSNHALKEELLRAKEEAARKDVEFEERLRALEEIMQGGGGGTGMGCNISDGASFGLPTL